MEEDHIYKYLGSLQARHLEQKIIKEKVVAKYILKLSIYYKKLNEKNSFKSGSTHTVQILMYTFGTAKWNIIFNRYIIKY